MIYLFILLILTLTPVLTIAPEERHKTCTKKNKLKAREYKWIGIVTEIKMSALNSKISWLLLILFLLKP